MRFIKIAVSFTSLIPCLVLPRELRETTEGTPTEDLMTKKALFLRLSPKKVDSVSEKVDSIPKKVDSNPKIVNSIPKSVVLSTCPLNKITLKATFIWSCQKNVVYLHPQFHAGDVCASSAGVADILKRRLLRSVLTGRNLANFELKNQDLATIDVLGMCISCTRVPFIWVYARICTYRRGLRVVGSIL